MQPNRPARPFVAAVPASASPDEIDDAVRRWQSTYQPHLVGVGAAPAPAPRPPEAPVTANEPRFKEIAAGWYEEARQRDRLDSDSVRQRVSELMGRRGQV
jgi:hypothetical protein